MDYIILGLLILSNRTIYQLRSRIDKGLNMMYSSSTGSIQAALKKLLNSGYIDYHEFQDNGKQKKEYCITEAGRQSFHQWVNAPVHCAEIKFPDLSKVYFMGFSQPENRLEIIQAHISELNTKYQSLKLICSEAELYQRSVEYARLDKQAKDIIVYRLASAHFGRDFMSFTIKWYENLLNEMRKYDEQEKKSNH